MSQLGNCALNTQWNTSHHVYMCIMEIMVDVYKNEMWCNFLNMDQNIEYYGEWAWRIVSFFQYGVKSNLKIQ